MVAVAVWCALGDLTVATPGGGPSVACHQVAVYLASGDAIAAARDRGTPNGGRNGEVATGGGDLRWRGSGPDRAAAVPRSTPTAAPSRAIMQ